MAIYLSGSYVSKKRTCAKNPKPSEIRPEPYVCENKGTSVEPNPNPNNAFTVCTKVSF